MRTKEHKQQLLKLDDAGLIDCVRQHNPGWHAAASILLNRYRADVLRRCHHWLGNQQDAEDGVQETLLRAYRALPGFKGDASFRTWLFAIADNNCHRLAARRSRHVISDHLRGMMELHEELRQHPQAAAGNPLAESTRLVLDRLPAPAREILVLRFFQDFSLEEIAQTLGIGLSATKMRLYRSLEQFKDRYSLLQAQTA